MTTPTTAPASMRWDFPLPRTHTGVLIGNGTQGLMVWGDERLHITVGRAGFWDHRGAAMFVPPTTYRELVRLLQAGDTKAIERIFVRPDPAKPYNTQVGCGRIELRLPDGFRPVTGDLDLGSATLRVTCADARGRTAVATVRQAMDAEVAWIELDPALAASVVSTVPTWDHIGTRLASIGCAPPERWHDADHGGFCQTLPEDDPLALSWRRTGTRIVVATALGADAAKRARALADSAPVTALATRADRWWDAYWRDVPTIALPDPSLQRIVDYGLYKQAGLTTPGAPAAGLQGAWLEEYQLPPWSSDYHFNINVQMIYWPSLASNRTAHLQPLWDMLRAWLPRLRTNGAAFFGAPDALMLPHAVDDRCGVVGSFWTGTIDHGCAAWMAQLAWLHYRYELDEAILRDIAWPLMEGSFNGYWAMAEQSAGADGPRMSLPVTTSPEYGGDAMNAWGRDASFQLAAFHFLARALPDAARALGKPLDPRWARVGRELPPYTLEHGRIALWQGQDLAESHRHHSHLASLYPFTTVDAADPAHREVVERSLEHWVRTGPGAWSGWCVPWASILCARVGWADAAVQWLHWWTEGFTNIGHGTLHDADIRGCTTMDGLLRQGIEIMQIEAGMGALNAVFELLVQNRGDTIHVLPSLPRRWRALTFDGIRCEGAFQVGATVAGARVVEVRVRSLRGGRLRLAHGMGKAAVVDGVAHPGAVIERDCAVGGTLVVRRG